MGKGCVFTNCEEAESIGKIMTSGSYKEERTPSKATEKRKADNREAGKQNTQNCTAGPEPFPIRPQGRVTQGSLLLTPMSSHSSTTNP